jgi:hypothetical protein
MANRRVDRTGHQLGVLVVVEPDQENPRLWRIRCTVCGAEQSVSAERCVALGRAKPKRCRSCPPDTEVEIPEPPKPIVEPAALNGIDIAGYGFFPFLTH